MKRIILLLITFSCFGWIKNDNKYVKCIFPTGSNPETIQVPKKGKSTSKSDTLTAYDRKHYFLRIDERKITSSRSTSAELKFNRLSLKVSLEVTNSSNDTLKYITMSCAWDEIFTSDKAKIHIIEVPCDSNFPIVKMIPPHKSTTFRLPVTCKKTDITPGTQFRLGMYIYKFNGNNSQLDFDFNTMNKSNLIWSNTVTIPK